MAGSLEKEFLARAARASRGVVVFSPEVAIELVEIARSRNLPTLGLDAFLLHPEGKIQPDMQYDLDTSSYDEVFEHLRRFVGTSYYFEIYTE